MKLHETRYSFILTNSELVAIRRLEEHGNLQISDGILWTAHGTETRQVMTVILALWYLGMLALIDEKGPQRFPATQNRGQYSKKAVKYSELCPLVAIFDYQKMVLFGFSVRKSQYGSV